MNPADSSAPPATLLSWRHPLPAQVAAWLIQHGDWDGEGPLDLSRFLVVVPTRQSGRRLREALAEAAAGRDQAVFAPTVVVPEALPEVVAELPALASRDQVQVAWMRVLLTARPADYRAVFPVDPPRRDETWAQRLAMRLTRVQQELAAGGLRMADVLNVKDLPETARWRELAQLEEQFDAVLAEQRVRAPGEASRAGRGAVQLPVPLTAVVVAGCPDPNPVALRTLEALRRSVPIDVLVYGPTDGPSRDTFDAWGRPRASVWGQRLLELADFPTQVQLVADPAQQARRVAERALAEPRPEEWLALAIVDPEITAPLTRELEDRGATVFLPEGESWRKGALYGVLQALADLSETTDCRVVGNLLRCPAVMTALAAAVPGGVSPPTLLRHWDRVMEQHLPPTLAEAQAHAGLYPALQQALGVVAGWGEALQGQPFAEVALTLPAAIWGDQPMASDEGVAEAARQWVDVVARIKAAIPLLPQLPRPAQWRLALAAFAEGTRFAPRPTGAIELGGWLEVLWADAPRLIIAGANDGCLPDAVCGDAFLPEALREPLGLKTNAERLAVDAYLMAAAVASRPEPEDVLILVSKTAASGDPLRPSRILLAGADETLAARVQHLFRPVGAAVDNLPWRRAWPLRPRRVAVPATLGVTALRDWLQCPFRFYLTRGLKMSPVDLPRTELDAMEFGTLVHGVLETMGRDPRLRATLDEAVLRDGLLADFEHRARRQYGEDPALPLLIQFESARQRLRRVATLEIAERAAGWRTERVEWKFALPRGGLTITGKVDRIDRHADGRVRVIDYKTSDTAAQPRDQHLQPARADEADRPAWLRVEQGGALKQWVDLQLPLYRRALAAEYGPNVSCAYFNLPKAIGETGLAYWEDETDALQPAAETCADGVVDAILAGHFWPPVDRLSRYDEAWATLFHHGIAASVDETWIQAEVAGA